MRHPDGLPARHGRTILDMLDTAPADRARRIERPSADLPIDLEFDWEPRPLARAVRSGRRFRWTVVTITLLLAVGLYGGWHLGLGYIDDHIEQRSISFREAAAGTIAVLDEAAAGATAITDAGTPTDEMTAAIGPMLHLDVLSTRLDDAAAAWLLDLPDLLPTPRIADLSAARRSLEQLSVLTDSLTARIRLVADYRLGLETILTLPELPSTTDPIPASTAQDRLAGALADAITALGDLPDDPSLADHRDAVAEWIAWMGDWQPRYVELLRAGDLPGAQAAERAARGHIDLIRLGLRSPLDEIDRWADGVLASIESTAGRVLILSAR